MQQIVTHIPFAMFAYSSLEFFKIHKTKAPCVPALLQVFVRMGIPNLELYPIGVQLVMSSSPWLACSPLQMVHLCALLTASSHLYPASMWTIRWGTHVCVFVCVCVCAGLCMCVSACLSVRVHA